MSIRFSNAEIAFLWCIPEGGRSLTDTIHCYVFIERIPIPSYKFVKQCLNSGVRANVLKVQEISDRQLNLVLSDDWYNRIHSLDDNFDAMEDAIMEICEELVKEALEEVNHAEYTLPKKMYDSACKEIDD